MSRHDLIYFIVKCLLTWLIVSALIWWTGEKLILTLFPLLIRVIENMDAEITANLLLVNNQQYQTDALIRLSAKVLYPIYIHTSNYIAPGTQLKTSAHLLHVLVPLVIELTLLSVWPVRSWLQRLFLLGSGVLSAILIIMAILPAQLLGSMEISFQEYAMQGEKPRTVPWFVDWMVFCEMGGRWLLAIIASWLCIHLQRKFVPG